MNPVILFLDLETRSEVDLPKVGVYKYAEHESTDIALFAWAINDEPVEVWDKENGEPPPRKLALAMKDYEVVKVAHNSGFDRTVINEKYTHKVPVEEWEDTMVIAYTLSLPGQLAQMMLALDADVDYQKESDGKRLVRLFCKPQKTTKSQPHRIRNKDTDPEDWEKYKEYAKQDVEAMRWAYRKMPQWVIGRGRPATQRELDLWHLSEKINDRGLPVDIALAEAAIELTSARLKELDNEVLWMTDCAADSHSQRDRVLAWIRKQGVDIKGYTKEDLTDMLKRDDLPPRVRRVLSIRQEAGRTSTAKYQTLLESANSDGRLRGGIQYYGAKRTGRYAGRRFQPHNLPHPEVPDTDNAAEAIINGTTDMFYDESVMALAVSCVRSAIKAPEGMMLGVSDLANIEGRVLPWLAGEAWKLKAFLEYDQGKGADIYKLAFHKSFGTPIADITKDERQIGKFQELSLGYQGGVGAFYKQAKKFGTDMDDIYNQVIDKADEEMMDSALWMVNWIRDNRKDLDEVSDEGIIGADIVKQLWRQAHPKVCSYWYSLEQMVRMAIENPGGAFKAGLIQAKVRDDKLIIMLPSKRPLVYNRPKITKKDDIIYMNHDKGKWRAVNLYGGKIAENVVQAVARDVLTYNMIEVDKHYPIIGTVHDEVICETDNLRYINADEIQYQLNEMLATNPPWSKGLPLAANGYIAQRYKKD